MISKEGLRAAATEADQAILCSLPAENECEHEFSKSFEKKIQRIRRIAKYPVLYRLPKQIACVFLMVILAVTSWLTFDVEARAAFFAWVKVQYEHFVEYRFMGDVPEEIITYELTWLPDGFDLVKQQTMNKDGIFIYENVSGQQITFSYSWGSDAASLFIMEYAEIIPVEVAGRSADFYLANNADEVNALIWISADEEMMFCITACQPQDVLVKIAEGIAQTH